MKNKKESCHCAMFEQKSVNENLRELIDGYVREHNIEAAMKELWCEIGSSMKKKGYKISDVKKTIRKVYSGK